ncbi:hypothetical protein AVEN_29394-1, partial [Araneus ventricosus]
RPRWPSGKVSGRRAPGSKPDSTEDPRVWGLLHAKSYAVTKRSPVGPGYFSGPAGYPSAMNSNVYLCIPIEINLLSAMNTQTAWNASRISWNVFRPDLVKCERIFEEGRYTVTSEGRL